MLVMAARYEHIHKLILPKLRDGYYVICDRFVDSTACYQGLASEIGTDKVFQLHQELMSNLMPDITFFINVESTKALRRTLSRGNNNKFEAKNSEFHQQVSQSFQQLAERYSSRIVRIDADALDPQGVHHKVIQALSL